MVTQGRYTRAIEPFVSPTDQCPSCAADLQGAFCHGCGQRIPRRRLTLAGLWRELPARVFNLERGLLHTFLDLWRRPGVTARDFVAGRRSPYVTPLTYFLVAAAIQLIGLALVAQTFQDQLTERVAGNSILVERFAETLGDEDPARRFAELYFHLIRQGYTYLFLFYMSIPFALYLRFLTRRLEPRYNLAEVAIFSLYTTGHLVLITGLLVPITGRLGVNVHALVSMTFYFSYTGFAARGFFDGGARRVVLTLIALVAALLTFLILLMSTFGLVLARAGG